MHFAFEKHAPSHVLKDFSAEILETTPTSTYLELSTIEVILTIIIPPANEHSFNSSRFLQLIFTQSICNYQTESWWDLFSLDICFLFAFLWMQLSRSYWHSEDLSSYQIITLLLPSERLNKLRFTPLPTTVYLSHLPSPTPSYNLPSNRFPKYIRNKRCFIFLQEIGRKITENNFRVLK